MTAREVKEALYARHFASAAQMPGPWTCIEEFRGIDLLAFSAWSTQEKYARVGYEVKVSRSDLRSELLNPGKRAHNVAWCNTFYLAVPKGLLTDEEIAWAEPEWPDGAFERERCPNYEGWRRRKKCVEEVPVPRVLVERYENYRRGWSHGAWTEIPCRVCGGRGYLEKSLVEREAPTLWVPRDVGLMVVDGRGTRIVKKSPRRKEVPALSPNEVGTLVRWVSMRPDPRHHPIGKERIRAA